MTAFISIAASVIQSARTAKTAARLDIDAGHIATGLETLVIALLIASLQAGGAADAE